MGLLVQCLGVPMLKIVVRLCWIVSAYKIELANRSSADEFVMHQGGSGMAGWVSILEQSVRMHIQKWGITCIRIHCALVNFTRRERNGAIFLSLSLLGLTVLLKSAQGLYTKIKVKT